MTLRDCQPADEISADHTLGVKARKGTGLPKPGFEYESTIIRKGMIELIHDHGDLCPFGGYVAW